MADSKNPPVLPEGYDPELAKANKGFAAVEKEQAAAQAKLDAQDQKAKDKAKALVDFAGSMFKSSQEPAKKRTGGSVGYKAGGKVAGKLAKRGYGCVKK